MRDRLEGRPDAELLQLSAAGDESAFLLLYERLKGPIFRYAFYMTTSKIAAEEVVQEVFMFLLKNGSRYKPGEGDLAGFVFGVARNFVRRIQKRERLNEELPGDEVLDRLARIESEPEELSTRVVRHQALARVRAAIRSLPDHYRQVIVLCDLCELTYREAASRLQCAVGTIRSRRNRAHALLAEKLKQAQKPQPELSAAGTEECLI
jgi:RNA polymerase sigma-70 factor (ECF subfamily)